MPGFLQEQAAFLRQVQKQFHTTGAIAPSSRYVARAVTAPMKGMTERPLRILEAGPGTGAVTREIVRLLGPGDHLALVELNPDFVAHLQGRFEREPTFQKVAAQVKIHNCAVQNLEGVEPFDIIISGLPLNNFTPGLAREIIETLLRMLKPNGVLSYFEYMFVRRARGLVSGRQERTRLRELEGTLRPYLDRCRFRQDWIFANLPPAWVQHLRKAPDGVPATPAQ